MTDIVTRLRSHNDGYKDNFERRNEAADEIARLKALLTEAADELAQQAHDEHPNRADYPDEMRRYKRDMDLVNRIRNQP